MHALIKLKYIWNIQHLCLILTTMAWFPCHQLLSLMYCKRFIMQRLQGASPGVWCEASEAQHGNRLINKPNQQMYVIWRQHESCAASVLWDHGSLGRLWGETYLETLPSSKLVNRGFYKVYKSSDLIRASTYFCFCQAEMRRFQENVHIRTIYK